MESINWPGGGGASSSFLSDLFDLQGRIDSANLGGMWGNRNVNDTGWWNYMTQWGNANYGRQNMLDQLALQEKIAQWQREQQAAALAAQERMNQQDNISARMPHQFKQQRFGQVFPWAKQVFGDMMGSFNSGFGNPAFQNAAAPRPAGPQPVAPTAPTVNALADFNVGDLAAQPIVGGPAYAQRPAVTARPRGTAAPVNAAAYSGTRNIRGPMRPVGGNPRTPTVLPPAPAPAPQQPANPQTPAGAAGPNPYWARTGITVAPLFNQQEIGQATNQAQSQNTQAAQGAARRAREQMGNDAYNQSAMTDIDRRYQLQALDANAKAGLTIPLAMREKNYEAMLQQQASRNNAALGWANNDLGFLNARTNAVSPIFALMGGLV